NFVRESVEVRIMTRSIPTGWYDVKPRPDAAATGEIPRGFSSSTRRREWTLTFPIGFAHHAPVAAAPPRQPRFQEEPVTEPDKQQLIEAMWQFVGAKLVTKPLYAAASLRVPDQLLNGPLPVDEIARRTGTHAPSLYRVLRGLASVGIFTETAERTFANTPASELFVDDPHSLRAMLLWMNDPRHDHAWEQFPHCVRTGESAVSASSGKQVWDWLRQQPDLHRIFNAAMSSNAANLHDAAVKAYDFNGIQTLVDVGGGHGQLLMRVLESYP